MLIGDISKNINLLQVVPERILLIQRSHILHNNEKPKIKHPNLNTAGTYRRRRGGGGAEDDGG